MSFPMYFRSTAGNSYYKIKAENVLEEVQSIGNSIFYFEIEAKIYPEMLLIKEFIEGNRPNVIQGDFAEEFEERKILAKK